MQQSDTSPDLIGTAIGRVDLLLGLDAADRRDALAQRYGRATMDRQIGQLVREAAPDINGRSVVTVQTTMVVPAS
jgi:hypothetical protein